MPLLYPDSWARSGGKAVQGKGCVTGEGAEGVVGRVQEASRAAPSPPSMFSPGRPVHGRAAAAAADAALRRWRRQGWLPRLRVLHAAPGHHEP